MLHELQSYCHLLFRYVRGTRDRFYFYSKNYRRILFDLLIAALGALGGLSLFSISSIAAAITLAVAVAGAVDIVRHLRSSLTKAAAVVPAQVAQSLGDRLSQIGGFSFWIDRCLNLKLDHMTNPIALLQGDYNLPPLVRKNAPALFWNKPVLWKTTNEDKIRICGDLTNYDVDSATPISLRRATYFDGLITNDLAGRKLRTSTVPRRDIIDFASLVYDGNRLFPLSTSTLSNHVGGSLMAITRDAKLIYQEQGKDTEIDPGMLAPAGSGSLDWADIDKLGGASVSFRELVVGGLERELREELSAETGPGRSRTWLIGYARVLHRGGKPDFVGLTLLRQLASDLRIRPREDGFVSEIKIHQMESVELPAVRAAADELRADLEKSPNNVGYALLLSMNCLCEFLSEATDETLISSWYAPQSAADA